VTEERLRDVFSRKGEITDVKLKRKRYIQIECFSQLILVSLYFVLLLQWWQK